MKAIVVTLLLISLALSSEQDHHYVIGDQLYAWTNRIGPYHNPHETYDYFSLPFCKPSIDSSLATKKGGFSEILEGVELQNTGIIFAFKEDIQRTILCTSDLTTEEAYKMQLAVSNHYWYQMEVDGLPIWANVGDLNISEERFHEMESHSGNHEVLPENSLIYTHRHFTFGFNKDRIVEVNMTASDPQLIEAHKPIIFTYSTAWVSSTIPFEKRFNRYLEYNFVESQIHWFSIFNSFMIVVFLAGLVTLIMMRTLKLDYIRYSQNIAEIGTSQNDDSGWKRVHGDVFRPCEHLRLYCILMANGAHILFSLITALIVIILVTQYVGHDRVLSISFVVYAIGFLVNGFVSGSLYKQAFFPRTSPGWKGLLVLSASFGPLIILFSYSVITIISVHNGSYASFPFKTVFMTLGLFTVICLPLQIVGTLLGRAYNGNPNYPCRTSALPSIIPSSRFYSNPRTIRLVSGVLPFGCIFIEVFFLFASIWSYKYYYVYGFLIAIIFILMIAQICVSIVGTYLLLNAENYQWRWTSFLGGASIGLYLFLYCIYFYVYKTKMSGFVQGVSFFIESTLIVLVVSLFCGFVSSLASSVFVKSIFKNIKVD